MRYFCMVPRISTSNSTFIQNDLPVPHPELPNLFQLKVDSFGRQHESEFSLPDFVVAHKPAGKKAPQQTAILRLDRDSALHELRCGVLEGGERLSRHKVVEAA